MPKKDKLSQSEENVSKEDCTFQITFGNAIMLNALCKYSQMLDYIVSSPSEEKLDINGLLNSILAEGMTKRIKDLVKKHGFEEVNEFIDLVGGSHNEEELFALIKEQERIFYQKMHDEILSHMPIEDKQMDLPI
jgi:F0F1-type ATP synthase delta subunit